MKKIIFLLILCGSFCGSLFATEKYLVEKPDLSVWIVYYFDGASDSLADVLNANGLTGLPISRLNDADIPKDRSDRKYLKKNDVPIGSKILIDNVKKQADETAEQAKDARKRAVLKMTPAEYAEAKDL